MTCVAQNNKNSALKSFILSRVLDMVIKSPKTLQSMYFSCFIISSTNVRFLLFEKIPSSLMQVHVWAGPASSMLNTKEL